MKKIFNDFIIFFTESNIGYNIIITVIATFVAQYAQSFSINIVEPILNRDGNNDGVADVKKLKNFKPQIFGIQLKLGEFIASTLKMIIMVILVFFIMYPLKKANIIKGLK